MDLGIEGNTALVTASSSGLGRASAKALAREGVDVVINGRDEYRLRETVKDLRNVANGEVVGIAGDVSKKNDIKRLVRETIKRFDRLDHLVTCAGGPPSKPFLETKDDEWYTAYDMLVMSVVRLVRESAEPLKLNNGNIVCITSISVKESIENLVLSNSVRMAVIGLVKTLSRELGPEIRVNSVLPGAHETSRIENLVGNAISRGEVSSYNEGLTKWSKDVPLGRIGQPIELGEVVAFLCSERASYLNGVSIPIDGGASRSNL